MCDIIPRFTAFSRIQMRATSVIEFILNLMPQRLNSIHVHVQISRIDGIIAFTRVNKTAGAINNRAHSATSKHIIQFY